MSPWGSALRGKCSINSSYPKSGFSRNTQNSPALPEFWYTCALNVFPPEWVQQLNCGLKGVFHFIYCLPPYSRYKMEKIEVPHQTFFVICFYFSHFKDKQSQSFLLLCCGKFSIWRCPVRPLQISPYSSIIFPKWTNTAPNIFKWNHIPHLNKCITIFIILLLRQCPAVSKLHTKQN